MSVEQTETMAEKEHDDGSVEAEIATEMSSKEMGSAYKALSATRKGKLSHCTRKMNEIKQMMDEGVDADSVRQGVADFLKVLDEFKKHHVTVQILLSEEEKNEENVNWYEPKMDDYNAFMGEVDQWFKRGQHEPDPQSMVEIFDSVSVSRVSATGSRGSKASSIASERMKAAADKAALMAKAEKLKRKHALEMRKMEVNAELEMEKTKLNAELETLAVESEIAASDARMKTLEHFENAMGQNGNSGENHGMESYETEHVEEQSPDKESIGMAQSLGMKQSLGMTRSAEHSTNLSLSHFDLGLGAIPKTPLQNLMQAPPGPSQAIQRPMLKGYAMTAGAAALAAAEAAEQAATTTATKPCVSTVFVSDGTHRRDGSQKQNRSTPRSETQTRPDKSELTAILERQTDLADLFMAQQRLASLPGRDVPVFDGDPLAYRPFMQAFKHNIENKTDSNEDRLYFLEQYTVGQPKELVRSCLHLSAATGYTEAKHLLKHHFGDDFKITTAYIEKALNWNPIRSDDGKALNSYALYLRSCGNAVRDLPYMTELDLPSNMKQLVSKLPFKLREKWRSTVCDIVDSTRQRPKFYDLIEFIEKQAKIILDPVFGEIKDEAGSTRARNPKSDLPYAKSSSKKSFVTAVTPVMDKTETNMISKEKESRTMDSTNRTTDTTVNRDAFVKPCVFCKGNHAMETCETMSKVPHKEKIEFLRKQGFCFACLIRGHMTASCKKRLTCQLCEKKHPTVLHIENFSPAAKKDVNHKGNSVSCGATLSLTEHTGAGTTDYKLAVVPVKVKANKGSRVIETYAFLDPGSNATFCTENLMEQLSIRGRRTEILLKTMGQERPVKTYTTTGLEVCSLDGSSFIELPEVFTQKAIPVSQENIPIQADLEAWPYLKDVQLGSIKAEVALLIGANVPKAIEPLRVINSQNDGPYAVLTRLGWTVNGPLGSTAPADEQGRPQVTSNRISVAKLEELLVQQYNQDFSELAYNEKQEHSFEDKKFLKVVNDSITKKEGHYVIRLPFRQDNICLPNNRKVAEQRTRSLSQRFKKDEAFRNDYIGFMNDVLMKGYAERVPEEQLLRNDGRLWYIPHHGVYHKRKKTIRVVFDCTSSFQGTSLNAELLQGPDLTNTLLGVLLRFRQEPVAVMADIEGMFHQVKIPEDDVDFLRFLWWPGGDTSKPLAEYRMTSHLFGAVSSPSCANFALKRTADDNEGKYDTEVLNTIRRNYYVDDCLKAVRDEKRAICLVKELTAVCATGGFKLTKWASNSRSVLNSVPAEERAKEVKNLDLDTDNLPVERALGMRWDVESDTFFFMITPKQQSLTRRSILSVLNSVYDPLGLLAPVMLTGKAILQELCKLNCGWDEEIPNDLADKWKEWLRELNLVSDLRVQRCLKPPNFETSSAQLHHFCDASERGYGTVSYLKLTSSSGQTHIAFVIGKARVAPLKVVTIPRLELAAAVLAARIDRMLRRELEVTLTDSVFWTDSTSVLKYIMNDTRRFQTYVANRVSTIRDLTHKSQWRYINTAINPADSASRGMRADPFLRDGCWLQGPDFLMQPESEWPTLSEVPLVLSDSDPEIKKTAAMFATSALPSECPLNRFIEHFSSWDRLIRSAAWLLKFKTTLRHLSLQKKAGYTLHTTSMKSDHPKHLSVKDLAEAEESLISYIQLRSFRDEMTNLAKGQPVKRSSRIYKLNPVLQNGILRVGGRLSKLAMPQATKHPAILPNDHHFSRLLLNHIHILVGHCGRNQMLSKLRTKYWIIKANSAARKITRECVLCRRWHGTAVRQKMADLPLNRITPDLPPFTHTGLDYFGPIEVKRGRSKVKRYGALFTCLASRAIHLEMAYTLDTDSCISALRRFICRRGQVKQIVSDNGTNFVGTERELREAFDHLNLHRLEHSVQAEGIKWTFNPPYGPHHGGVWERLIRTIKKILYSITKEQTLDDECLQTALCEVEAIMNDRPITTVSEDANDPEPLTPNHLLQMKGMPILPPGLFGKHDSYSRRRWKQVQYISDLFWKRWTREYLPLMQERQKWNEVKENLKPGDIVLIIDENSPRNSWPMGRIMDTYPDKWGSVRRVKVRTQNGSLERPITKLCLLKDMI